MSYPDAQDDGILGGDKPSKQHHPCAHSHPTRVAYAYPHMNPTPPKDGSTEQHKGRHHVGPALAT